MIPDVEDRMVALLQAADNEELFVSDLYPRPRLAPAVAPTPGHGQQLPVPAATQPWKFYSTLADCNVSIYSW